MFALVIPGLILLRGLYLSQYYIIDQDLAPVEALKKSFEQSKPHAGYIWGTIGVGAVFGILTVGIGQIAVVGTILSLAVGLIYLFGPALRYGEIAKDIPVELDTKLEV
jgi:uncharacterized membrane protein